jgi:hypothetical protein
MAASPPAKAKVLAGLGGSRPGGLPRDDARRLILIGSAPESGCGDAEPGIYGGFGEKDLEGVCGRNEKQLMTCDHTQFASFGLVWLSSLGQDAEASSRASRDRLMDIGQVF